MDGPGERWKAFVYRALGAEIEVEAPRAGGNRRENSVPDKYATPWVACRLLKSAKSESPLVRMDKGRRPAKFVIKQVPHFTAGAVKA